MSYIRKGDEITKSEWDELLDNSVHGSFFQSYECYLFYQSLSFLEGFVYAIFNEKTIEALVCGYIVFEKNPIGKFFSRRAIIPGGVLIRNEADSSSIVYLLETLKKEIAPRVIYIEIRNYTNYDSSRLVFESCNFRYHPHLNYKVDTNSFESTQRRFSKSRRRQIKLAEKEGYELCTLSNDNELQSFYEILSSLYFSKIKRPLFPYEFFKKLSLQSFTQILLVKHKSVVVGGIVCVAHLNLILYEWFVCGKEKEKNNGFASVMATWAGIKYASENNFHYFDFMGAGKPDEDYGVRTFKSKFGGTLVEDGRFRYISNQYLYFIGEIALKIRKLV